MKSFLSILPLLFSLFLSTAFAQKNQRTGMDWPQWRGPNRDGFVPKNSPWPATINGNSLTQSWQAKLGKGYPGPVLSDQLVFTIESVEGNEVVHALNRMTGEVAWKFEWEGQMKVPFFAAKNGSWVRSTPAFDGENLYVCGMRDVLHSLNAKTGEINWKVDFVERYKTPLPAFGMVCSPLLDGKYLYIQAGSGFVKLNKKTGQSIWRTLTDKGGMFGSAFSSPVIKEINGVKQLVVQTRTDLAGVDPQSGKKLWSKPIKAFRGMNILTPTILDNQIFTSSYGGKSLMLDIQKTGDKQSVQLAWENKQEGYMSGPIMIDGFCYIHLKKQRITCLDIKNGETKWISSESFGKYMSMVSNGKEILALDESGILYLIKPSPEKFIILEKRTISESPTWAHLAVSGNQLFIRELEALACYSW
jgi:outer membrane protein assembly factor BamB